MGDAFMLHRVKQRYPKFTYTGNYQFIDDGSGNWRIKFLSSGTLTFQSLGNARKGIDVFLVGGGGSGASYSATSSWLMKAGGGSGYTKTVSAISVVKGTGYSITIGAGGSAGSATGESGGNTTAFNQTAYGGNRSSSGATGGSYKARCGWHTEPGYPAGNYAWAYGGYGGSGGSIANDSSLPAQATNGANGNNRYVGHGEVGHGQGSTTREFGESSGTLYANGGGVGSGVIPNTGNGGNYSSAGSSGIVVIRNHRG